MNKQNDDIKYRLPTVSEWEYACNLKQDSINKTIQTINEIAWYSGNAGGTTHPVANKKSNIYGIYDLLGNVSELCIKDFNNHDDPSAEYVIMGGSWKSSAESLASGSKEVFKSGQTLDFGFRLICEISGKTYEQFQTKILAQQQKVNEYKYTQKEKLKEIETNRTKLEIQNIESTKQNEITFAIDSISWEIALYATTEINVLTGKCSAGSKSAFCSFRWVMRKKFMIVATCYRTVCSNYFKSFSLYIS